jgi:diaminopimelate epimerase
MKFSKLQATGNDFILLDTITGPKGSDWDELARAMCDRHYGIGADGLLIAENSAVADVKMRILNSDGSEAEACGNGLRCLAKYAIEKGMIGKLSLRAEPELSHNNRSFSIETLSGVRKVKAYMSENKVNQVEVNMGLPQFQPERIPVKVKINTIPILNQPLVINGRKLILSILSMGNPHAVSFSSQPVADFPLAHIGPKVERHTIFPQRTNFAVARVLSTSKIEARVWERGVGETLACGSGACAIAVVAQLLNYVGTQVDIILTGGTLTIYWDRVGEVLLTGPVEEVFTGDWSKGKS